MKYGCNDNEGPNVLPSNSRHGPQCLTFVERLFHLLLFRIDVVLFSDRGILGGDPVPRGEQSPKRIERNEESAGRHGKRTVLRGSSGSNVGRYVGELGNSPSAAKVQQIVHTEDGSILMPSLTGLS